MNNISNSIPEWITHLKESCEKEVCETANITLMPKKARKYIWSRCEAFGLNKHGLPGQACFLLERYLANTLFSKINNEVDSEVVERFMSNLKKEISLILGCCIFLVYKMLHRSDKLSEKEIQNLLIPKYTDSYIVKMELKVFQGIDYYIPSRTTVEIAQLLAAEIYEAKVVFRHIDIIVSLAELHKPSILEKVRFLAKTMDPSAMISRLHLAAGGVAAASYHWRYQRDPVPLLAHLTSTSILYITIIGRAIIVATELQTQDDE